MWKAAMAPHDVAHPVTPVKSGQMHSDVGRAFAFLVQAWAQRTISAVRIALVFALEPVFAGVFGYLHGDRLGWLGWGGCAVIMVGILVSEPAAAADLRVLVSTGRRRGPGSGLLASGTHPV